jgi:hypothetical protein
MRRRGYPAEFFDERDCPPEDLVLNPRFTD